LSGLALAAAALVCAAAASPLAPNAAGQAAASRQEPRQEQEPVTGNATHFAGLGAPYGGCGLPQAELETQDFVALNVYDTPGDYAFYPRPLPPEDADKIGLWDNGRNCGRWVEVTVGDYCTGVNDGAQGQAFCRGGEWVSDEYNGATLTMLVTDSCGDANAWCRDDPYHLDLVTDSLDRFERDGAPVTGLADRWNNRHVSWRFVPAPAYEGDIAIGFLSGAQTWWGAVAVSNLPNGIHGVEYFADGAWHAAEMNGDMGQSYVLEPTEPGGAAFRMRVLDVTGTLLNDGREYAFELPPSCAPRCEAAYTEVEYTTANP
jgi:hypothetical protein